MSSPSQSITFVLCHYSLLTRIFQSMKRVGEGLWAGAVSDSTAVTLKARAELAGAIETLFDLRDSAHHIHSIIKDITKLPEFKDVCANYVFSIVCIKSVIF